MKKWESAVIEVVIGAKPKDVFQLSKAWRQVADDVPEHGKELNRLLEALCGEGGWQGTAADEYTKIVKRLMEQMRQFSEDATQMSSHLDQSGDALSRSISKIPIPLAKARSWLVNVDHELPNGTAMDDSLQDPNKFHDALVADYQQDPSRYHDFLAWAKDQNNENHLRSAHGGATDYSAPSADSVRKAYHPEGMNGTDEMREAHIKVWYEQNSTAAGNAHDGLRRTYDDQRSSFGFHREHEAVAEPPGADSSAGSAPSGGASGVPGTGSAGVPTATSAGGGVPGDSWNDDPGAMGTGSGGLPGGGAYDGSDPDPWGSDSAQDGPGGTELGGSGLGGSGLASAGTPGGVGGPSGLGGGAGGLGAGGAGAGVVSAGSASAGPERSPMPPTTSAQQALAERRALDLGRGLGRRGTTSGGAAGMMPQRGAGGGAGGAEQYQTWLTEDDDDIWGGGDDAAPSVLK